MDFRCFMFTFWCFDSGPWVASFVRIQHDMLIKVKNDLRSKFSNLSNWKEEAWKNQGFNGIWFFQASSFQLLKLENLLRRSFFTLIYNRSSNIWIISYKLHTMTCLCYITDRDNDYLIFCSGTQLWITLAFGR